MEKWVEELLEEIDGINGNDLIEPEAEAGKGEKIVGELNQWAKKISTLIEKTLNQGKEDTDKLNGLKKNTDKHNELLNRLFKLASKLDLLKEMLFYSVHKQFGAWNKEAGIRKGFNVVFPKEKAEKPVITECTIVVTKSNLDTIPMLSEMLKAAGSGSDRRRF